MITQDTSWSYSSYSTALQCLRKYQYLYVDKLRPEQESGDLKFGSVIHAAVHGALEGHSGEDLFNLYWSSYYESTLEYGRFNHEALAHIGADLMRKFRKFYTPRIKPIIMEQRLYSEFEGIKLEGQLDCLGELDGVLTLIDFKTSAYNYSKDKGLIALQLNLYAYLVVKELGYTPKQLAYLPFIKSKSSIQEPVVIPFSLEKMYLMLKDMAKYINGFRITGPAKNPNSCQMGLMRCPFFTKCWGLTEDRPLDNLNVERKEN